jgi:SAM-dependent methyltransferase
MALNTLDEQQDYWNKRFSDQGEAYVGHIDLDHLEQKKTIENYLAPMFDPKTIYSNTMDFGCGIGRFIPFLCKRSKHIWAVDLVEGALKKAASLSPAVTPIHATRPFSLPFNNPHIDFLFSSLVFQHMIDDSVLTSVLRELKRVLLPKAKVIIIDNAVDRAPHVKPRKPEFFVSALGLKPGWTARRIKLNKKPLDHWLLEGSCF